MELGQPAGAVAGGCLAAHAAALPAAEWALEGRFCRSDGPSQRGNGTAIAADDPSTRAATIAVCPLPVSLSPASVSFRTNCPIFLRRIARRRCSARLVVVQSRQ